MADARPARRSLSQVGGDVDLGGSLPEARLLAAALDVAPPPARSTRDTEDEGRAHVHGFHAYPARMHPTTAARLIESFSPHEGPSVVLDPFCGSGTVLVEAMLQGHDAVGVDLNPLAIALSTLKTEPHPRPDLDALALAAESVARFADQRRKARAGATQRYPEVDTQAFDAHVLLELDSLRHGIHTLGTEAQRSALMLVLSAILVKVSRKESDTATREQPKRIAAGYPARLFLKKAEELCGRLAELEALLPKPRPHATLELDDATRLTKLPSASVDTVVTSPPYVATYDYLAHHDLRLRWLDLDASRFETNELGARRDYAKLTASTARERWLRDLRSLLLTLGRVTRRGGAVVLLMADSAVDDQPLPAEEIVAEATGGTALACVARASQLRHHYHQATRAAFRERPRAEHALLLERT